MNWYLIPLTLLAIFLVLRYFLGMKKNRWFASVIAQETERVLHPVDTTYVNIGGAIGYHSTYILKPPFKKAEGTFTFLPRQSALYLPFALLLGAQDRYYLTIHSELPLIGEGHIIEKAYYRKIAATIRGVEQFKQEERERIIDTKGRKRSYILLWDRPAVYEKLSLLCNDLDEMSLLKHLCVYPENRHFYLFIKPEYGKIEKLLRSFWNYLPQFQSKS
ncbi:MAG TPA: hypothetical protein PLW34_05650 [Termitinemataceae bacterium]|nr:hypothetical protein [Termitinemataceae bacterium]HOM22906.1 hypothetical protein [Termitinemataceae bacterium]HPQ00247.1 hypothetical protein [Termitinemataceae bacterium]